MYRIGLSSCSKEMNEELFAGFQRAGITAMEISQKLEDCEACDLEQVKKWADQYGVELWSYHLPFAPFEVIDISSLDESLRTSSVALLSKFIHKAGKVGIKKFIVHPSGEPNPDEERKARMEQAKKSLSELADTADRYGAVICAEDLPRTCLGNCAADMLELTKDDPRIQIVFDTNHLLGDVDIPAFIRACGDKIVTLHVSDYDFVNERHWMPGEGKIDWQALYGALQEVGYNGVWLYEIGYECPTSIIRDRDLTAEDFVRNAQEIFEGRKLTVIGKQKENLGFWG